MTVDTAAVFWVLLSPDHVLHVLYQDTLGRRLGEAVWGGESGLTAGKFNLAELVTNQEAWAEKRF